MERVVETLAQLKEILSPQAAAVVETMTGVYKKHKALGGDGKAKTAHNQFGDLAMVADVEAESNILNEAGNYAQKLGKVIAYRGEEMGSGQVGEGVVEETWIMDGLDGSENYKNKTDWPYGTMLSVANGADPRYEEFTTAAICMEEEGWIILATAEGEGRGVYVIDLNNGGVKRLPEFDKEGGFDPNSILADNYFPEAKALITNRAELGERRTGSTAATVVSMATRNLVTDYQYPKMNERHEILVDVTRKGNLEQPAVYLIMKLLGGDVLDIDGNSIGEHKFGEWGQNIKLPIFPMTNPKHFNDLKVYLGIKAER